MVKIKKIGVLSFGKIYGVLSAIMGLILGAFLSLFSLFSTELGGMESIFFGVGAIIILPIFYGIIGFIMGIIMALIYNLAAKWVGGLEVETEKIKKK